MADNSNTLGQVAFDVRFNTRAAESDVARINALVEKARGATEKHPWAVRVKIDEQSLRVVEQKLDAALKSFERKASRPIKINLDIKDAESALSRLEKRLGAVQAGGGKSSGGLGDSSMGKTTARGISGAELATQSIGREYPVLKNEPLATFRYGGRNRYVLPIEYAGMGDNLRMTGYEMAAGRKRLSLADAPIKSYRGDRMANEPIGPSAPASQTHSGIVYGAGELQGQTRLPNGVSTVRRLADDAGDRLSPVYVPLGGYLGGQAGKSAFAASKTAFGFWKAGPLASAAQYASSLLGTKAAQAAFIGAGAIAGGTAGRMLGGALQGWFSVPSNLVDDGIPGDVARDEGIVETAHSVNAVTGGELNIPRCPNCYAMVRPGARACSRCGTGLTPSFGTKVGAAARGAAMGAVRPLVFGAQVGRAVGRSAGAVVRTGNDFGRFLGGIGRSTAALARLPSRLLGRPLGVGMVLGGLAFAGAAAPVALGLAAGTMAGAGIVGGIAGAVGFAGAAYADYQNVHERNFRQLHEANRMSSGDDSAGMHGFWESQLLGISNRAGNLIGPAPEGSGFFRRAAHGFGRGALYPFRAFGSMYTHRQFTRVPMARRADGPAARGETPRFDGATGLPLSTGSPMEGYTGGTADRFFSGIAGGTEGIGGAGIPPNATVSGGTGGGTGGTHNCNIINQPIRVIVENIGELRGGSGTGGGGGGGGGQAPGRRARGATGRGEAPDMADVTGAIDTVSTYTDAEGRKRWYATAHIDRKHEKAGYGGTETVRRHVSLTDRDWPAGAGVPAQGTTFSARQYAAGRIDLPSPVLDIVGIPGGFGAHAARRGFGDNRYQVGEGYSTTHNRGGAARESFSRGAPMSAFEREAAAAFGSLNAAVSLPHEVAIAVPSTVGTSKRTSQEVVDRETTRVAGHLGKWAGGFEIDKVKGGYVAFDGSLVQEPINVVRASMDAETLRKKLPAVEKLARNLGGRMDQELVSMTVDGQRALLPPSFDKFLPYGVRTPHADPAGAAQAVAAMGRGGLAGYTAGMGGLPAGLVGAAAADPLSALAAQSTRARVGLLANLTGPGGYSTTPEDTTPRGQFRRRKPILGMSDDPTAPAECPSCDDEEYEVSHPNRNRRGKRTGRGRPLSAKTMLADHDLSAMADFSSETGSYAKPSKKLVDAYYGGQFEDKGDRPGIIGRGMRAVENAIMGKEMASQMRGESKPAPAESSGTGAVSRGLAARVGRKLGIPGLFSGDGTLAQVGAGFAIAATAANVAGTAAGVGNMYHNYHRDTAAFSANPTMMMDANIAMQQGIDNTFANVPLVGGAAVAIGKYGINKGWWGNEAGTVESMQRERTKVSMGAAFEGMSRTGRYQDIAGRHRTSAIALAGSGERYAAEREGLSATLVGAMHAAGEMETAMVSHAQNQSDIDRAHAAGARAIRGAVGERDAGLAAQGKTIAHERRGIEYETAVAAASAAGDTRGGLMASAAQRAHSLSFGPAETAVARKGLADAGYDQARGDSANMLHSQSFQTATAKMAATGNDYEALRYTIQAQGEQKLYPHRADPTMSRMIKEETGAMLDRAKMDHDFGIATTKDSANATYAGLIGGQFMGAVASNRAGMRAALGPNPGADPAKSSAVRSQYAANEAVLAKQEGRRQYIDARGTDRLNADTNSLGLRLKDKGLEADVGDIQADAQQALATLDPEAYGGRDSKAYKAKRSAIQENAAARMRLAAKDRFQGAASEISQGISTGFKDEMVGSPDDIPAVKAAMDAVKGEKRDLNEAAMAALPGDKDKDFKAMVDLLTKIAENTGKQVSVGP